MANFSSICSTGDDIAAPFPDRQSCDTPCELEVLI